MGKELPLIFAIKPFTRKSIHQVGTSAHMSNTNINKARRQARKKNLAKRQAAEFDQIKATIPDMNEKRIFGAYQNKQDVEHPRVLAALTALDQKVSKLSQGYIAKRALAKAEVNTLTELKKKLRQEGVDITGLSNVMLERLVALDDWGTIFKAALPLIQTYGAPVLRNLYHKYVKPKIDRFMGGDEGINPADWGGVLGPRRFTPVAGENMEIPGVKSVEYQSAGFDTVDPKSIASTIAPELFKHRYAFVETMKSALANVSAEYSITTNASGQVGVAIFTLNNGVTGSTYQQSFVTIYNDATFSVTTGTQTPTATFAAGPLQGVTTSVDAQRSTNFSVQVIPTASFNTAGAFTLGYQNRFQGLGYSATNIGTTLSQLKTFPFVTSFNNKTIARMINVTGDPSNDSFSTANNYSQNQYFVLLGSGLPASTEVARIVISGVVEFLPAVSALPICVLDYPRIGPMTENFESMMFMRFPVIQQLDLQDARRVADALPSEPTPFNKLFAILTEAVTGIQPRQYVSHIQAPELELPGMAGQMIYAME